MKGQKLLLAINNEVSVFAKTKMNKHLNSMELSEFSQRSSEYIKHIDSYEGNKSDVVDVNLIDVIKKLNQIPGVATVFSCEGHYERNDRELIIVLACTQEGEANLQEIMLSLFTHLSTHGLGTAFSLELRFLVHPEKYTPYIARILRFDLPFKTQCGTYCSLEKYDSVKMKYVTSLDEVLSVIIDQNKIKPIYSVGATFILF